MKKVLLQKILSTGLFLLFVTSLLADVPVTPRQKVLKRCNKSESIATAQKNKRMGRVELNAITRTSARYKTPNETVVEYPDSMIVFTPDGIKTYITKFEYDDNNKLTHLEEFRQSDLDNTWIPTKEQIVRYDEAGLAVYNEFYELIKEVWTGTKKAALEYDEYGNIVYQEQFYWNATDGKWMNNQKESSSYRPDGKLISEEGYYWGEDGWFGSFKDIYEYNELGLVTRYNEWEWEDDEFIESFYYICEYDAIKPLLLKIRTEYELDYATNEFSATAKGTFTYDANDELEMAFWQESEDGEWVNDQRIIYEHINGKMTLEEGYGWENGDWGFSQRWEGEYDAEGREIKSRFYYPDNTTGTPLLSSVYTHEYDTNGNQTLYQIESIPYGSSTPELILMQKEITEYDEASRNTLHEVYGYDMEEAEFIGVIKEIFEYTGHENDVANYESYVWGDKGWTPATKEVGTYDNNNLLKEIVRSEGDATTGKWVEGSKYQFTYNENSNLLREDYFVSNGMKGWIADSYLIYYYPIETGIQTNNQSTHLNIQVNQKLLTVSNLKGYESIRIHNINGQMVQNAKSQGNTFSIALPQGVYIICVGNETMKVSIK